jgi:hypothetical protein
LEVFKASAQADQQRYKACLKSRNVTNIWPFLIRLEAKELPIEIEIGVEIRLVPVNADSRMVNFDDLDHSIPL